MEPDFSGWATKAGIRCADGRTIMPKAFEHQDQMQVPLVWGHGHSSPDNVLGHAILESRPEGIYAYGFFNDTPAGQQTKALVVHGDVKRLSIWANELKEQAKRVIHGMIKEVSVVLHGANPEAMIDQVRIQHGDDPNEFIELADEAIIHTGLEFDPMEYSEEQLAHAGRTVADIVATMNDDQRAALNILLDELWQQKTTAAHSDSTTDGEGNLEHQEGNTDVTNVFESQAGGRTADTILSHSDLKDIAKAVFTGEGTFKEVLKHALQEKGHTLAHGIENLDVLFPDARALSNTPTWITRRMEWVEPFLAAVSKTPFSRVKSVVADITADEARAKGYVKGTYKKEEWFSISKRVTTPATIYKKQKLDRDDIIDVEDFDLVSWMKGEMTVMIKEELAIAILAGDGRAVDDPDKIKEPSSGAAEGAGIRSIMSDHEMYTVTVNVNVSDTNSNYMEIIDAMTLYRQYYKGSGAPNFYTTETQIAQFMILRDEANSNRRLYTTLADLAAALRVNQIIPVEALERFPNCIGIMVNPSDYNLGAAKGGELTNFDDFDIDYNQYKYLIETRLSGALTVPFSAMVINSTVVANLVTPTVPSFVTTTGVVTIPAKTGVVYKDESNTTISAGAMTALAAGDDITIHAIPASTYFFPNTKSDGPWTFKRPAS